MICHIIYLISFHRDQKNIIRYNKLRMKNIMIFLITLIEKFVHAMPPYLSLILQSMRTLKSSSSFPGRKVSPLIGISLNAVTGK